MAVEEAPDDVANGGDTQDAQDVAFEARGLGGEMELVPGLADLDDGAGAFEDPQVMVGGRASKAELGRDLVDVHARCRLEHLQDSLGLAAKGSAGLDARGQASLWWAWSRLARPGNHVATTAEDFRVKVRNYGTFA